MRRSFLQERAHGVESPRDIGPVFASKCSMNVGNLRLTLELPGGPCRSTFLANEHSFFLQVKEPSLLAPYVPETGSILYCTTALVLHLLTRSACEQPDSPSSPN
jgi:hypothetical protein